MPADMPPPLPFITTSALDPRKFEVGAEAVAFLCSLPARAIAPVAVAGRYRTGKSFLLNRLSGGGRLDAAAGRCVDQHQVAPSIPRPFQGVFKVVFGRELHMRQGQLGRPTATPVGRVLLGVHIENQHQQTS